MGYRRGSQNAPLVTTLAGHLRLAAISADGRRMKVRTTFVRDSDGARSHTIVSDPDGNTSISTTTGRYFGVAPELGVDLGPVRLAATYNAIVGTSVEYRQTTAGGQHREGFSPDYLSLELSFRFGGGRKPTSP